MPSCPLCHTRMKKDPKNKATWKCSDCGLKYTKRWSRKKQHRHFEPEPFDIAEAARQLEREMLGK